jgi:signal transduction histidine kinase
MKLRGHNPARERSAQTEKERLVAIVERMADGIVILGMDGSIRFANPAAEELFGRRLRDLTGSALGFPAVAGELSELEVVRPGGASVTAELRVVETDWGDERVQLVSLRDITDRKRATERAAQLQRERIARAEAEASSQAKSEFLATMSHELRTPLNAVIGYAELLDLGIAGSLSDVQRTHVGRIRNSARHLLGLVNEVLDLAKVEAGRLTVQNQTVVAADTLDAAMAMVQPQADAKNITVTAHCDPANVVFQGDRERVRQILVNLMTNAVKFTELGGKITMGCSIVTKPASGARLTGSGPWVRVVVEDNGIGIPADRLGSIFDPFVQVEGGRTRQKDGTGLGLTISRRLARLMGGDLTVRSEAGRGSSFSLWLPEATDAQRDVQRWQTDSPDAAARLVGLSEVGRGIHRELPALMDAFVERLRDESIIPGAESLRRSQLSDHLPAFVTDLGNLLILIEESRGGTAPNIMESAEIQLYIAERHGRQRARMGWTVPALRREWAILHEELERATRRGAHNVPERAVSESLLVIERLLEQAEDRSRRALERATPRA